MGRAPTVPSARRGNVSLKNVKGLSFTDDRSVEMSLCKHMERLRFISHVHADEREHTHTHMEAAPVNDL